MDMNKLTLKDASILYIKYLKQNNYSRVTIWQYKRELEIFIGFLLNDCKASNYILQLNREDILKYLIKYSDREKETTCKKLSIIRSFLRYLRLKNIVSINACMLIDAPRKKRYLPRVVQCDDLQKMFAYIKNNRSDILSIRDIFVLSLLYGSGIRLTELHFLDNKDIDTEKEVIKVRYGKGSKERIVPISKLSVVLFYKYTFMRKELVRQKLYRYIDEEALIINYRGIRMSQAGIQKLIRRVCINKGIKNFSPHSLRHTFATTLLEKGMSLQAIQKLLGHNSLRTTQIYADVSQEHLKNQFLRVNLWNDKDEKQ